MWHFPTAGRDLLAWAAVSSWLLWHSHLWDWSSSRVRCDPALIFSVIVTVTAVFCCFAHIPLFLCQWGPSGVRNARNRGPLTLSFSVVCPCASLQHAAMSVHVSAHLLSYPSFRFHWPRHYQGIHTILTLSLVSLPPFIHCCYSYWLCFYFNQDQCTTEVALFMTVFAYLTAHLATSVMWFICIRL